MFVIVFVNIRDMKNGENNAPPTEPELVVPVTVQMPVIKLIRIDEDNIFSNGVSET